MWCGLRKRVNLIMMLGEMCEWGWVSHEILWWAFLWLKWARLPPAVLSPSILSKEVETGPTATQFGPTCAQTMPRLPRARLRWAERGACPLFLPQKKIFSNFCRKRNFSLVSDAKGTFLQFLP